MLVLLLVFLPFGCGIIDYIIGKKSARGREMFTVISTFAELFLSVLLVCAVIRGGSGFQTGAVIPDVFSAGLCFFSGGFRAVYSLVTSLMWAFTSLFSLEYFKNEQEHLGRYYFFILVTLGATQGVMLSGSLLTTYVFFEILSLTSVTWVMHEETEGALRAGYTYLFISIFGGLILFMGMALLQHAAGTLVYSELPAAVNTAASAGRSAETMIFAAGICILIGFGCKAGMFPVHVWLPKAHPVAPAPASALLSGVLTKVGIYGIIMISAEVCIDSAAFGWTVLILGTITMFLGALLALFSVNLKRTLACSSMSQIGFILTGIGMMVLLTVQAGSGFGTASAAAGSALSSAVNTAGTAAPLNAGYPFAYVSGHALTALSGVMLHMVNHSLLKLSLFCAAGVVVMNIHALDLNRIRGWGRNKYMLKAAFLLGLLGISGVPLFNGYASKTLLHEAIAAGIELAGSGAAITSEGAGLLHVIEWVFLISGGCTFAYMLKLFICVFVERNSDSGLQAEYDKKDPGYMGTGSRIVIFGTALMFPVLGQKPVFSALASFMTGSRGTLDDFHPLSAESLSGGCISLGIGILLYLILIRRVLMKDGSYMNRWPAWLDLEEMLYRPLMMKWLPGLFGAVFSVFGENKILKPVSKGLFVTMAVIAKTMSMGTDALVVVLRRSILKERAVTVSSQEQLSRLQKFGERIKQGYAPLTVNFSFALMLSCVGIIVIFAVILLSIVV